MFVSGSAASAAASAIEAAAAPTAAAEAAPGSDAAALTADSTASGGSQRAEGAEGAAADAASASAAAEEQPGPEGPSIRAEVFFGGIDQCCGAEGERGTGACSVLAFCVGAWLVRTLFSARSSHTRARVATKKNAQPSIALGHVKLIPPAPARPPTHTD